jgi:hypothetical protein
MPFLDDVADDVAAATSMRQLWELPLVHFLEHRKNRAARSARVRVLVLNATCNGFGDVVFGYKIHQYLENWYGNKVISHVATTSLEQFLTIGARVSSLVYLRTQSGNAQCRKFKSMQAVNAKDWLETNANHAVDLTRYDVYLVAPITSDLVPDFDDVRALVPTSTRFNTYFMSEYNMSINRDIAFATGLGNGRLGLLFTNPPADVRTPVPGLHHPYSIMYIADYDRHLVPPCYQGFLQLLTTAHQMDRLDVVCSSWLHGMLSSKRAALARAVHPHYTQVLCVNKQGRKRVTSVLIERTPEGDTPTQLVFRMDVLPLKLKRMAALYKHSLPQVLLTGDQSITDFLSVRRDGGVVPFYQGLPWKQSFYTNLAVELPQRYLSSKHTSCGNVTAVTYHPDTADFLRAHDFRHLARPLMDAVITSAAAVKTDATLAAYQEAVIAARNRLHVAKEYMRILA